MAIPVPLAAALADRYRIERELGQGGMATVYLAEDLKHHRKVAIKVLRPELSASVGSGRFLREIEIAAQLQHPNILPLLDSGETAGQLYYVMPFVEGQSLRQRLARERELPIGEAVRLLVEIVDALAYAHQHGVVHRDIKPDNVMLTGRHALVADFGVAKAVSEASGSNTLTSMGVALGTPTYMAPEQAMADPHVDQRADLYAVGVVAYELLAGRPPFQGITPQQMLALHVTERPDPLSRHRAGVSPALEQAIMRCLEKLPADRWQSADELLHTLEPLATPSGGTLPTAARLPAVERPGRKIGRTAGLVLILAAAAFAAYQLLRPKPITYALGRSEAITTAPGLEITPAISPDGKFVAYAAGNSARMRIFLRPVAGGRTIPLSDDSLSVEFLPRWSPDGGQLLFLNQSGVVVGPAFGGSGSSRIVAPRGPNGVLTAADWSPNAGEIAFVRNDSLLVTPLAGGTPRLVTTTADLHSCVWSPNGKWLSCVKGNSVSVLPGTSFGNLAPSSVGLVPAAGGAWIDLTGSAGLNQNPAWASDSRRIFFVSNRDGPRDIYVQAIGSAGKPDGPAARLSTGLDAQSIGLSADDRRLTYAVYRASANIESVRFPANPPSGPEDPVALTAGNQIIEGAMPSHDGRWLVYDSDLKGNSNIWRIPAGGGTPEQLTSDPFDEFAADLSPDGRFVAYHAFRTPGLRQIEVKPLDGGPVERVTRDSLQESNPFWSPDGNSIAFFEITPPFRLSVAHREGPGRWSRRRQLAFGGGGRWSPDGKTLVFVTSGRERTLTGDVRLVTMPADSGPMRVIYAPGPGSPLPELSAWSKDGKTIYFKSHDAAGRASIWSVPAAGGKPRLLVHFDDLDKPSFRPSFSTDEKRIYVSVEDRQSDVFVAELVRK